MSLVFYLTASFCPEPRSLHSDIRTVRTRVHQTITLNRLRTLMLHCNKLKSEDGVGSPAWHDWIGGVHVELPIMLGKSQVIRKWELLLLVPRKKGRTWKQASARPELLLLSISQWPALGERELWPVLGTWPPCAWVSHLWCRVRLCGTDISSGHFPILSSFWTMSWPIYNELFWELLPSNPPPLKFLITIFFLWLEMRQRKGGGQRLMMNDFVIILSRPGGKVIWAGKWEGLLLDFWK